MPAGEAARDGAQGPRAREHSDLATLAVLGGQLAHDFNELLVGVLGNAALAKEKLPEDSSAYAHVADVEAAALRAKELVRTLVAYCGAKGVTLGAVRVEDAVRSAVAETPGGECVRVRVAPGLPEASGSASQLEHLVGALVANALDAVAADGGLVRLSVGEADLGETSQILGASGHLLPAGRYVEIVVADDGHGMDAATRSRAFEACFSTRSGGRGLGLTAARRITAAHRGSLEIESEPGRGTNVRVLLPVRRSAPAPPVAAVPRLVLVVDDEEGVLAVARGLLESAGYEVLVAAGGLEAVDVFRAHADEIDVVVLDRNMPRVGGEATFRALRRERADLPVLLCSGSPAGDSAHRLLGEGVAGFISKPFTGSELAAAVAGALLRSPSG